MSEPKLTAAQWRVLDEVVQRPASGVRLTGPCLRTAYRLEELGLLYEQRVPRLGSYRHFATDAGRLLASQGKTDV